MTGYVMSGTNADFRTKHIYVNFDRKFVINKCRKERIFVDPFEELKAAWLPRFSILGRYERRNHLSMVPSSNVCKEIIKKQCIIGLIYTSADSLDK